MKIVKALIAPLSLLFILATSPVANASENPFGVSAQAADQMQLADSHEAKCGGAMKKDGKCGEGKCGGAMKKDTKCGEGKCGGAMKKDGKCGEGKCGDSMKGAKEGKCGGSMKEGKCGGAK